MIKVSWVESPGMNYAHSYFYLYVGIIEEIHYNEQVWMLPRLEILIQRILLWR